ANLTIVLSNPCSRADSIKNCRLISVRLNATLDTEVAVEEANVNASGRGKGRHPYLLSNFTGSTFKRRSPPRINKASVGLASSLITLMYLGSMGWFSYV